MGMGAQGDVLADISIDRAGEVPIGVQLAWALRARIGDGRLAPGERLPGLRELAETLGINANTARTVYQRLEQEGLIDSRQGTGTFVAPARREPSVAGQIAADAAKRAHTTGVDPREVAAALYVAGAPNATPAGVGESGAQDAVGSALQAGNSATAEGGAHTAAERRQELRAQIAALEQTLLEMHTRYPGVVPTAVEPTRRAGPRLLSVEDLEDVRIELVRRLAEAEPLLQEARIEQREAAELRRAEIARTTASNARSRESAERKAAERHAAAERGGDGERNSSAKRAPGKRAARGARPGPSTA